MAAHDLSQAALGRPARAEERELAVSGPRPEAILALLVVAVLLMSVPAFVILFSAVDSDLLGGARAWAQGMAEWLAYVGHARIALFLLPAGLVARAQEDV